MDRRTVVTRHELARAIAVWLTVMPKHIWKDLENYYLLAEQKRQEARPQVEEAVADHLAARFERAKWEVSYEKPLSAFEAAAAHD